MVGERADIRETVINKIPSISALFFKWLSTREPERFSVYPEHLHVTDLYDACFRQIFLSRQHKIPVEKPIPPALKMKFEMGIAIEEYLRKKMIGFGVFQTIKPVIRNDEFKIIASPDGRLHNGMLLEIKGMNPDVFRLYAKRLIGRHRFQLEAYLWLDNAQQMILFCATWGSEKQPFRDHLVSYNLKTADVVKKSLQPLLEAEQGGALPGRVCRTPEDQRAILCPVRHLCFNANSQVEAVTIKEQLQYG